MVWLDFEKFWTFQSCQSILILDVPVRGSLNRSIDWKIKLKVLKSLDYFVSTIFFIIMNVRAVSFPGWALPWYQWTFYYVDEENGASYISTCMDIFGLTFFMSLPFSFLPQLIIWICGKIGSVQKCKSWFEKIQPTSFGTWTATDHGPGNHHVRINWHPL